MRHLAVYQFLRAFPGQYEVVRRLLAHRTVTTTRAFYAGLEARFAARQFDDLVCRARRDTRPLARAVASGRAASATGAGHRPAQPDGGDAEMAAAPSSAPRGGTPRARLVWPVETWPEIDRHLWLAGLATLASGDDDDGFGLGDGPAAAAYAAGLAETTVKNARLGYGRWLATLAAAGELDPAVPPAARVTKARAKLYLRALRSRGNSNHTLRERLRALHRALRILQPEAAAELGWLTARLGLLPVTLRPVQVYDSAALEAWGHEQMREALAQPRPPVRQAQYRDGLLIAILATRAPRLRSLAAMRLGQHVVREADGKGWRLAFAAEDVKTRRPIEYALPASLVPCIDRYLASPNG